MTLWLRRSQVLPLSIILWTNREFPVSCNFASNSVHRNSFGCAQIDVNWNQNRNSFQIYSFQWETLWRNLGGEFQRLRNDLPKNSISLSKKESRLRFVQFQHAFRVLTDALLRFTKSLEISNVNYFYFAFLKNRQHCDDIWNDSSSGDIRMQLIIDGTVTSTICGDVPNYVAALCFLNGFEELILERSVYFRRSTSFWRLFGGIVDCWVQIEPFHNSLSSLSTEIPSQSLSFVFKPKTNKVITFCFLSNQTFSISTGIFPLGETRTRIGGVFYFEIWPQV